VQGSIIEEAFAYELKFKSYAACADLFRYLVLYVVGGAYADVDVLPGPEPVPLSDTALFGRPSRDPHPGDRLSVEIRFIQAKEADPVILRLLREAASNEKEFIRKRGYLRPGHACIMERTGPIMAGHLLSKIATERNVSLASMLLRDVTEDDTVDNNKEHHPPVPSGLYAMRREHRKDEREKRKQQIRSRSSA
jgi:mannosyltransferase OCH1-like enzyme